MNHRLGTVGLEALQLFEGEFNLLSKEIKIRGILFQLRKFLKFQYFVHSINKFASTTWAIKPNKLQRGLKEQFVLILTIFLKF